MCWLGTIQQPGQRVLHPGLDGALAGGRQPLISNTDQGCQFTSEAYLEAVESVGVDVSMDGRGRWIDNRFIERLCAASSKRTSTCRITPTA